MIKFASTEDINAIMRFVDDYWKKGHILGNNKLFFEYEHRLNDFEVSFIISSDVNNDIDGILGYIPYGKINKDIANVMWKSISLDNTLGLKMLQYLHNNANMRIMLCPGINKKTHSLYRFMGYEVGQLQHWYRLNNKDTYSIAKVIDNNIPIVSEHNQLVLKKFNTFKELETDVDSYIWDNMDAKPYKEKWYIEKRYFNHPIYQYNVYGVIDSGKITTVIFLRLEHCNNQNIIRFIDCIGDYSKIQNITNELDELSKEYDAEYIDIYETGLNDDIFENSGWIKVVDSGNVIPNYFNPFVQDNIDIYYFSNDKEVVLFKGDGDQDRPS